MKIQTRQIQTRLSQKRASRRGAVAILAAILSVPMLAVVAFSIDYGYLLWHKAELQRAADAAALAAALDLQPSSDGSQDLDSVRSTVRRYANLNISQGAAESGFDISDADIETGRYDTSTIYSSVSLLNSGTHDTVRVTLRRDAQSNSSVSLFFARVLGIDQADVTATATASLPQATGLTVGTAILPFAVPEDVWNDRDQDEIWSIYSDGKIYDGNGGLVPGNFGTVDIGNSNNSTADLRDQILNGLRQSDLDALYDDGRIPQSTHINASVAFWANADPGLSSGIKSAIEAAHGQTRLIPIYDTQNNGNGNNFEYHITMWGVVEIVDSQFQGSKNTYVRVSKSYRYDGHLTAPSDLSSATSVVEGGFSSPVLFQ